MPNNDQVIYWEDLVPINDIPKTDIPDLHLTPKDIEIIEHIMKNFGYNEDGINNLIDKINAVGNPNPIFKEEFYGNQSIEY